MDIFKGNVKLVLWLMVIIGATLASPMFYKKKENDIYEPGEWTRQLHNLYTTFGGSVLGALWNVTNYGRWYLV